MIDNLDGERSYGGGLCSVRGRERLGRREEDNWTGYGLEARLDVVRLGAADVPDDVDKSGSDSDGVRITEGFDVGGVRPLVPDRLDRVLLSPDENLEAVDLLEALDLIESTDTSDAVLESSSCGVKLARSLFIRSCLFSTPSRASVGTAVLSGIGRYDASNRPVSIMDRL